MRPKMKKLRRKNMTKTVKNKRAFTLIELLVVVLIIGIKVRERAGNNEMGQIRTKFYQFLWRQ